MDNKLNAISPLDGRYSKSVEILSEFFSESALMGYRLKVEIEYLIALGNEKSIKELPAFSKKEQTLLRKIYLNFNSAGAEKIKEIEATTNHDVKAIEYYIQGKVKKTRLAQGKKLIRPDYTVLNSSKLNSYVDMEFSWQEDLSFYMKNLPKFPKDIRLK